MAFFMVAGRHEASLAVAGLWCCSLLLTPALHARDAAAYLPAGVPVSPAFWWGLDLSQALSDDRLVAADLVTGLQTWLSVPRPGWRPYPQADIRLGLLAVVPDHEQRLAARVLHPPVALDASRDWPAQERSRLVELTGVAVLSDGDRVLDATLPALPDGAVQTLELTLPVLAGSQLPVLQVEIYRDLSGTGTELLRQGTAPTRLVAPDRWRLDLSSLATAALPEARWRLRSLPESEAADWRWQPWSATSPAEWFVSWREAARRASGREQLLAVLDSLRPPAGASLPGSAVTLAQAMTQLQAGIWPQDAAEGDGLAGDALADAAGCAPQALLQLGLMPPEGVTSFAAGAVSASDWRPQRQTWQFRRTGQPWAAPSAQHVAGPDTLSAALDRWRDRALAPAPVLAGLQPRQFEGALLGLDAVWLQPVPGRLAWSGNHEFFSCSAVTACPTAVVESGRDLRAGIAAGAATLPWLSDAGLADGQLLRDWRDVLADVPSQDEMLAGLGRPADSTQRALLQSALQAELAHPPLTQGVALHVDDGPDPARPGGRRAYLAWGMADGGLLWLDADSDQPLWGWRPAQLLRTWLRHRLDPGAADPGLVAAGDWQLWPGNGEHRVGLPRFLYGLADGHLLALDISQAMQPRRLFRLELPPEVRIGSFSVFSQGGGDPDPVLLLARGEPAGAAADLSADALWLVDGRNGHILWRAARSGAAADVTDARLQPARRAIWQRLVAPDGRQLLYGVDLSGQVWRLTLPADGLRSGISLQLVAVLADASRPSSTERFQDAPSLTWLPDGQGGRLPALALGSRVAGGDGATPAAVFALADRTWSGAATLSRGLLAEWPATRAQPPDHQWGWLRRWSEAGAQLATPPRWLQGQVIAASETAEVSDGCLPMRWRTRLYRLPWRVAADGSGSEAEEKDAGVIEAPLSSPLLTETGALVWTGREGAGLTLPAPVARRVRTGKQPVSLPR